MNWKEQPHLFANGKFKMEIAPYSFEGHIGSWIEAIHGSIVDKNGDPWLVPTSSDFSYSVDRCTLIARPISDMSDEEIKFAYGFDIKTDRERLINSLKLKAKNGTIPSNQFLRIKSIGVYPFDQSHFEDGTVININEL